MFSPGLGLQGRLNDADLLMVLSMTRASEPFHLLTLGGELGPILQSDLASVQQSLTAW